MSAGGNDGIPVARGGVFAPAVGQSPGSKMGDVEAGEIHAQASFDGEHLFSISAESNRVKEEVKGELVVTECRCAEGWLSTPKTLRCRQHRTH